MLEYDGMVVVGLRRGWRLALGQAVLMTLVGSFEDL
jgi:hypothetical protein